MKMSYKPLLHQLIDHDLTKTDLIKFAGITANSVVKISRGELLSTTATRRLCNAFRCDISDIMKVEEWDTAPIPTA